MVRNRKSDVMPSEMLDRLQEHKLRGLQELLDSWDTAPQTMSEAHQAGAIADSIVDEGIGARQGLLRLWDYHWSMTLAGEMPERREHGAKLRSLLERGGRILARAAAVARGYTELSGLEVARLSQFEEQVRTFPLWIEECLARWEMLDRPRPPLNRARADRSRAAFERGECEAVADIIARFEHGVPLTKE